MLTTVSLEKKALFVIQTKPDEHSVLIVTITDVSKKTVLKLSVINMNSLNNSLNSLLY